MNECVADADVLTQIGDPSAYFQQIETQFHAAVQVRPDQLVERDFLLAGQLIRTRVVGTRLAETLTRSFDHLRVAYSDQTPALVWEAWDGEATDVARPLPPPAEIVLFEHADERAVHRTLGPKSIVQTERAHADRWVSGSQGRIIDWFESPQACSTMERTRPLMELLPQWLSLATGVQMFHSALVAFEGRGAMLIGRSGAGKTTTALNCLTAGLDYLGDDYCAVSLGADTVTGYSLFAAARLFSEDLDYFPALRSVAVHDPNEDKALVLLHPAFERQLVPSVPIRALLLPRQVPGVETSVRSATAVQVALELMPSMRLLMPDMLGTAFERSTALAERLPCYWLDLGDDLRRIPAFMADLLHSLGT